MASPLVGVKAIWEKGSQSEYPEMLRVPMDDGHVVNYRTDVEQPHPCFLNAMEILKSMPKGLGYQYRRPMSLLDMFREWHKKVRGL